VARAQQPALPVIGYLSGGRANPDFAGGFRSGLAETGFAEGRNVAIEYRPSDYQYDRLPGLVADLIARKVAVIAASGAAPAVAATSQPRSLLSIARLNMAKSRLRSAIWSLVRIDQTCFGRSGGFAPISLPLFQTGCFDAGGAWVS
jgi:hypothetical protein